MQISVQMYSVRDALAEDYQGTVGRLVELGFAVAEPFALLERRDELVKARDSFEIAFPSAHQSFLGDDDFIPVLEAARLRGEILDELEALGPDAVAVDVGDLAGLMTTLKALPLAYVVALAFIGMTLLLVYADIVKPVKLT